MRKRRGRGEDGIYRRESDGRWVASVSLGYDGAGKRVRRVVYGATKREAQDKLDALRRDAGAGVKLAPGKVTVGEAVERWLDLEVRPNRAPATVKCYADTARLHVLPALGRVPLKDLDTLRIDQLQAALQAAGVSPRTRELVHAVLSRCLRRAVKWGLIGVNPAAGAERPKVTRREVPRTTPAQAEALLAAAAGHRLAALFTVAVGTGLRQGEAFGLRWRDVDLAAGVLTVRHSLEELNGVLRLKAPKTASGVRAVELPGAVRQALAAHRKSAVEAGAGRPGRRRVLRRRRRVAAEVELLAERIRPGRAGGGPRRGPVPRLAALPRGHDDRAGGGREGGAAADRAQGRGDDAEVLRPPAAGGAPGSGRQVRRPVHGPEGGIVETGWGTITTAVEDHGDVMDPAPLADLVHLHHVRVVRGRRGPRLVLEALEVAGIRGRRPRQDFERHTPRRSDTCSASSTTPMPPRRPCGRRGSRPA